MLFEFKHNNQVIYSGDFKSQAYSVSKFIQDNPDGEFSFKVLKKLKRKTKVVREITNACDISERCLWILL
jgi:hypothetical protein